MQNEEILKEKDDSKNNETSEISAPKQRKSRKERRKKTADSKKEEIPNLVIREMEEKDMNEVFVLHKVFPVKYTFDYIKSYLDKNHFTLVLVKDDGTPYKRVLGFASVKLMYTDLMSTNRTAYLATFGVDPNERRHHYGSDIMQVIFRIIRRYYNIDKITLHMQQSNIAAKEFYLKNGWKITQNLPNFYHFEDPNEPKDAYSMRVDIEEDFFPTLENQIKFTPETARKMEKVQKQSYLHSFFANK